MRILVLGATGYVGSRLVPALLDAGHEVVAASSSPADPDRFAWGRDVTWRQCDVADEAAVARAVRDADAVCYLVHALRHRGFSDLDRVGATHVRDAASAAGVRRLVYLSGLVPTLERGQALSEHLASRLEVEQILEGTECSTLTIRAGVVIGAGSTSYEVVRQLASLLLVQPVPGWMRTRVQPVAVSDVVRALVAAYEDDAPTGNVDLGGPDVIAYPELLAAYARAARLPRLRVRIPVAPVGLVGLATAALVGAPFWTVTALVESLRHDMLCRPGHTWTPDDGPMLDVEESLARSVGRRGPDVDEAPLPSDEAWTRMRAPVLDELHAPAFVRAGASLALRRWADARGVLRHGPGR
jgi:uncharacterized protein YbjT (DUF2867 family)